MLAEQIAESGQGAPVPSVGQQSQGRLAMPLVGVLEHFDEGRCRELPVIEGEGLWRGLAGQAVDASAFGCPAAGVVARVVDSLLVHVTDVDRSVWTNLDVDRAEPLVGAFDRAVDVPGLECCRVGANVALDELALQGFDSKEAAVEFLGQRVAIVDDEVVSEPGHAVVLHRREVPEGIGVRQRAVLGETLSLVGSLDVMESPGIATIGPRENASLGIDFHPEGVSATLGKDLVLSCFGMVSPDQLAHRVCRFLVDSWSRDVTGRRASLAGVQPSIGTPSQAVGHRV